MINRKGYVVLLGGGLLITAAWLGAEKAADNSIGEKTEPSQSAVVWKGFIPDMKSARIVQEAVARSKSGQTEQIEADEKTNTAPETKAISQPKPVDKSLIASKPSLIEEENKPVASAPLDFPGDKVIQAEAPVNDSNSAINDGIDVKMSLAPLPVAAQAEAKMETVNNAPAKTVTMPKVAAADVPKPKEAAPKRIAAKPNSEAVSAILPRTSEKTAPATKVASSSARKDLDALPVKSVTAASAAPVSASDVPSSKDYSNDSSVEKKDPVSKKVAAVSKDLTPKAKPNAQPLQRNELSVAGTNNDKKIITAEDESASGQADSRSSARDGNSSSEKFEGTVLSLSRQDGKLRMLISSMDRGVVQVVATAADYDTIPAPGSEVTVTGRRIEGNGSRKVVQARSITRKSGPFVSRSARVDAGPSVRRVPGPSVRPLPPMGMLPPGGPMMGGPMMGRGPIPFGGEPHPFPMM